MLNIYLVRHGQDKDNAAKILNGHRNMPLTKIGRSQAKQLSAFIKSQNLFFDKVYSSPLKRAYQTASEITRTLGLKKPEILPDLIERDFGILTGKPVSAISNLPESSLMTMKNITYFLKGEGVESFPKAVIRAKRLLKFIKEKHQDGNILLVSHGDFGKTIYAAYYNLPWREAVKSFYFGNTEMILLSPKRVKNKEIFKTTQFNA